LDKRWWWLGVFASLSSQPAASWAQANPQPLAAAAKPADPKWQLSAAKEQLQAGNEASVREGLQALTQLGGEAASAAVAARLRRGLSPQLIEPAIDALVKLKRPSASPALLELAQHRRAHVRAEAVAALAALQIKSAESALLYALDDPSPEVRAAAVSALERVGNARAVPALLTAAERGVPGAWRASASLTPAIDPLLARAQTTDVAELRPALDTLLARKDLPHAAKLRAIAWVTERGSVSARVCLLDWLGALPEKASPALRHALLTAVETIDRDHPESRRELATSAAAPPPPAAKQMAVGAEESR
jgi:HEAT repeat protein